jgi:hypothetical protein
MKGPNNWDELSSHSGKDTEWIYIHIIHEVGNQFDDVFTKSLYRRVHLFRVGLISYICSILREKERNERDKCPYSRRCVGCSYEATLM